MMELPDPPAHVAVYVEVLGLDLAVEFLLRFGGAELYVAKRAQGRGALAGLVGEDLVRQLAVQAERLPARVPLAKPWIAAVMRARGLPVAEIARRLHTSDVAVRRWFRKAEDERNRRHQLNLF